MLKSHIFVALTPISHIENTTMKLLTTLSIIILILCRCGGSPESSTGDTPPKSMVQEEPTISADPMENKGIGPISEITLGPVDQTMVAEGQKIYQELCSACHKPTEKFIGPAPAGIMGRRSPEWIMNMILNPEEMVREDPIAKELLVEYNMAPMANQNLTEEQARNVLEYFRTLE